MADSDDDYVQGLSDEDEADLQLDGAPTSDYGTRRAKGKGKERETKLQGRLTKSRWEATVDFGPLQESGKVGAIAATVEGRDEARKRARLRQDTTPLQRGIIRHLVLVLDLSEAMLDKDMRPNRYIVTLNYAQAYVREFFEQNPISQMCVMGMHDGICVPVSELSGNPEEHIEAIKGIRHPRSPKDPPKEPKGSPSLQNALEMARAALYHTPAHGTREVIIVLGALLTLDPGDIYTTIKACTKDKLRVNIIGMSGRLKICQEICSRTNSGDDSGYVVAQDQDHLRQLLNATTTPPVMLRTDDSRQQMGSSASLLMMGFPSRTIDDEPTLCACHGRLTRGGYICARCASKVCSLPATCPSCHLTLILSTHLARSYHHLFPLRNWAEVSWQRALERRSEQCKGCLTQFPAVPEYVRAGRMAPEDAVQIVDGASESHRYECQACENHFCIDCDVYCHEVVHNCPGCLSQPVPSAATENGLGEQGDDAMDVG